MTLLVTPHGETPLDPTFAARVHAAGRVIADVGTGDGKYAFALAQAAPDALVVGIDPAADALRPLAVRAARKRGGAANLVLLRATVEQPPDALVGTCHEVHVILPWGHLFEGLVTAAPDVLGGLAALCAPSGRLHIVANAGAWDSVPARLAALPRPTVEFASTTIAPALDAAGFTVDHVASMTLDEARAITSTWAGRLAHRGRTPDFTVIEARRS